MHIELLPGSNIPIYEQIIKQIKKNLLQGELEEGEMLPSIRLLARELKISVITTKRAYEELEKEGLIYSVPGKGFYVKTPDREFLKEEQLVAFEARIGEILEEGIKSGVSRKEVLEIVNAFYEEQGL